MATTKRSSSARKSNSRSTSSGRNTTKRMTKKERMMEIERKKAFRDEIILWIVVAVSLLLIISNFGVGGKIGNAVSCFLFGVFGLLAYLFPVLLLVGSFFAVANRGNKEASMRIISIAVCLLFLCLFLSLIDMNGQVLSPKEAFAECYEKKNGGGILGGILAYILVPAFGRVGAYIIDILAIIISLILFTGKSLMKTMKKQGQRVYESAKENNEKLQEYREYKSRENEKRRLDKKVAGVAIDTTVGGETENVSDEMNELHPVREYDFPSVKEEEHVAISSGKSEVVTPVEKEAVVSEPPVKEKLFSNPKIVGLGIDKEPKNEIKSDEIHEITSKVASVPAVEEQKSEEVHRRPRASEEEIKQGVSDVENEMAQAEPIRNYVYPTVDLLKKNDAKKSGNTESQLRETAQKLQQTLQTFGVNVNVTNISCGPAVTRYEIQPEMGVKVSKIVGLADDIKLNLAAADIRIEAPIPGKAAVGIEVPNKENVMVSFRELMESKEFADEKSKIAFAVGRDIAGKVKVANIGKMPHLLIAGATGSGKSVCINTIIMSILYKADPNEVKLLMIDPKVVELSVYNGIPHLMIPVVTDPKKAAGALNWAVQEMTDRYQKFADTGVRDIEGYNEKIAAIQVPEGQERPAKMPKIVIIVDELADLMMVASGDVEEAICRLAQLARACGIHLVIATQRPSVNVITGLIKANMPSRIAFAVTSGVDSRTILDMVGAEKLLGKGDMLFYPQGIPKPLRVQGAFVSDKEVADVVEFLKQNNGGASYNEDVAKKMETLQSSGNQTVSISDSDSSGDGRDSYFMEAAKIIIDKDKASIGMIQRYLKVGFNRAARIMDQLEEAGVVGPEEGTKPRKVLMGPEEFEQFIDENA